MMHLLQSFASLALLSGVLLTLLPEGSLRRTASMAVGLLMLTLWADGLSALLMRPETVSNPAPNLLTSTGADLTTASESAQKALRTIWEDTQ